MEETPTLPSIHWFDRVQQVLVIAIGMLVLEVGRPWPFLQTFWGRMAWAAMLFFTAKNLIRHKRETSIRFNKKVVRAKGKYEKYFFRLSEAARYRFYKVVKVVSLIYIWGFVVNSMTEKCTNALSCVVATPGLVLDNFQELLFFAIRLAMSFAGIYMTMFFVGRSGLFEEILPHTIKTRFKDVFGQPNAIKQVKEVVEILNDPEKVESAGGYMPGGILLTGPPGTGKTLIAEAIAGEVKVPLIKFGPDAFTSMWSGGANMKVKQAFKAVRKRAVKYGGVAVFMDEIDALGSRDGVGNQEHLSEETGPIGRVWNAITINSGNGALNTFLAEMQGMQESRGIYNKIRKMLGFEPIPPIKYRILWIGATNLSSRLDAALLRPGRFDRIIPVGYPDKAGIAETLKGYLDKVNHNVTDEQIQLLATNNPRSTGATIKNTVNEALLRALREGRDTVTWEDMRDAIIAKRLGDELGRTINEQDNKRVTLHEAAHAVAAILFREHSRIQFASVVRRGLTGGVVSSAPIEERFTQTRNELESECLVALASVWAEKFYFDDNLSTGPASDLEKATNIVKGMVGRYAMGNTLMVQNPSELTADRLEEVQDYLQEMYDVLYDRMYKYRDVVEVIAQELDRYGTIDGDRCYELWNKMTGQNK